jgi:hypothetical protein
VESCLESILAACDSFLVVFNGLSCGFHLINGSYGFSSRGSVCLVSEMDIFLIYSFI